MVKKQGIRLRLLVTGLSAVVALLLMQSMSKAFASDDGGDRKQPELLVHENAERMIQQGRHTFRFDTFGDEAFWGDTLKLHQAIAGAKNGGVGPGLSPAA